MKKLIWFAVLVPLVSGCVNGFEKFYQGKTDARSLPNYDASYVVPDGRIPIYSSSDMQGDAQKLVERGFIPVGNSSFYAPDNKVDARQLQDQAEKIGAHAVLFHSSYRDTVTGAIPLTLPNNTTSYTNGTATAYGSGGSATAYGTSTTTTYGTTTTMMPYSQSRSNFETVYFVKVHARIGIYVVALTDDERQTLQTNLAVKVKAVVQDSPAFFANVLPGDYVVAINSDPITSPESWTAALQKYEGSDAAISLLRNGQSLSKQIHINTIPQSMPSPSK